MITTKRDGTTLDVTADSAGRDEMRKGAVLTPFIELRIEQDSVQTGVQLTLHEADLLAEGLTLAGHPGPSARTRARKGETLVPAVGTCRHCGLSIQPVIVWASGVIDWENDGDSGCQESPDTDDEGTGGHSPAEVVL